MSGVLEICRMGWQEFADHLLQVFLRFDGEESYFLTPEIRVNHS
jgi:hypothetical protein